MALTRVETRTTTVRLPRPIYDQAKSVIHKQGGAQGAKLSLNDFIVAALEAYLKMYKRREIDAAFAGMAEDADYQKEARLLADEFDSSDWEALRLEEADLEEKPTYAANPSR